jgi:hypothetical protein
MSTSSCVSLRLAASGVLAVEHSVRPVRAFAPLRFGASVLLALLLVACGRDAPVEPPAATAKTERVAAGEFGLTRVEVESFEGRPAALLTFSRPLAAAQKFDELLAMAGEKGAKVDGSWMLDATEPTKLRFPYLDADKTFRVRVKAELAAADGAMLGKPLDRELYTGPLEPLLGFASQGSVLPAHETRGLPIVSVNVPEVDVEFLRVKNADLGKFLAEYTRNGQRSYWSLDQLAKFAESVYATRFAVDAAANQRTLTYLPVRDIDELKAPGVYFAVMKRPGHFAYEQDTAMFFVSDLGLHVRAYADHLVVHAASLESGKPVAGAHVELRNAAGNAIATGQTDGEGLVRIAQKVDVKLVLVATRGRDVSVLPFNQPALDLSEFAIAGRPQRAAEIFPWSGRDLYRPGELLKVAALLRDDDGKAIPAQPLFATLKQPDGRTLVTERLEPGELGHYAFERRIAPDAPTGRWSLELSTDPTRSASEHAFAFRVEEFLPERLELELGSPSATLAPGAALPLTVDAAYLYGAPASGNRFTAKFAAANDAPPVAALGDFHFGDPLVELPKEAAEAIDATLDENGHYAEDVAILTDHEATAPTLVVVQGSVYETGGRAVSRTLKRTIWPAAALVGVRPLFDLDEGSPFEGNAEFEVVRADAAGTLLAADKLAVRLVREHRDYHWTHDPASGWRMDYSQRFETVDERTLSFAAGERAKLAFPVEWGGYRVEIEDPETGLTMRLPFQAGWGWGDDNRGTEARPDKVKLALDKTHYRGGDTLKVTITPPHAGPALLLLESDELLWHATRRVEVGTVVEIPLDPKWERHDLYLTALVFRPGSSVDRVTPNRAVGIAHVPLDRRDRTVAVELAAADTMRPHEDLTVAVKAPQLAGQTARVRVTAVDLGVLNITRFPLPDAAKWFFAQRRLGLDAYDLYARVIESLDGDKARLRYGGDAALAGLPSARRPDPNIEMVDLFHAPVALDANGAATVALPVPDFNGTLRVRALVFGADRYGAVERDVIVRAPLVVEASTPRVMAPGDVSRLTLDVQNLSGSAGDVRVELTPDGPVSLDRRSAKLTLADQAKQTLQFTLTANEDFGVGRVAARVTSGDTVVNREFKLVVRPAYPAIVRSLARVYDEPAPVAPEPALLAGLYPKSVVARISLGTLPPLPFAQSVQGLIQYPYGCVEQTTSRAHPLVHLDDATAQKLGLAPVPLPQRAAMLADAFTRLTAMQNDTGHFGMWPGDSWVNTQMTPYVAELLLDARDRAFTIPEPVLTKALERLNDDLLSGGNSHYEYDHSEHLRLAEMAYGGYVLARVQKAPLGTLRAIYDNERESLEGPLPLVHLGVAFKLMGDAPRAEAAVAEAFTRTFERPHWLGDYGSELRDLALTVALTHEYGLAKPEYDAKVVELARELRARGVADAKTPWWLSTQEQMAIFRLGRALLDGGYRTFGASVTVGGRTEETTGNTLVSREFTPDELARGVRIAPSGQGPLYLSLDVAGYPRSAEPTPDDAELRIKRSWHRTDGTPYDGSALGEGDVLVAHLRVESGERMNDALVVDLLPGGLEIENLNLTDASQWDEVTIDGIALKERASAAEIVHEEYRDDRYVAAVKLHDGSAAHLFYLVRAVSPGTFVVPPPSIEDMYRPEIRAVGVALPATIEVGK